LPSAKSSFPHPKHQRPVLSQIESLELVDAPKAVDCLLYAGQMHVIKERHIAMFLPMRE
jgi:hypothetical protein